jgi:O-phospho-L-seryl-tRNASec:L-selenocysteinyl-tRNA synthase
MVLDALKVAGLPTVTDCVVLPVATGMSVGLALLAIKARRPQSARYVVWPRMDQKSCLKAITQVGLIPVVVDMVLQEGREGDVGGQLTTDVDAVSRAILEQCGGPDNVVAILSTGSCFAPRAPDK